jgi:hypothetical protein
VTRVRCLAASVGRRAIALVLLMTPNVASAQPHRGSIELGGAFAFTGGYDAGSAAASETPNPSLGSAPFSLFETDSRVLSAPGVDVHAGVYVSSRMLVTATFQYSRLTLRTRVSADFEGAADVRADTTVSSYQIGGGIEYLLAARGWIPFLAGGAGQMRVVADGGDVETSGELHAGGGVRHALTRGRHPFDVRAEAAASYRTGGPGFDARHHVLPSASAGVTWRF